MQRVKGEDLTGNSDPIHGVFDLSVYYIPQYSYSLEEISGQGKGIPGTI